MRLFLVFLWSQADQIFLGVIVRIQNYKRGQESDWFIAMRAAGLTLPPELCAFECEEFTDEEAALVNGIRYKMLDDDIDVVELAIKYWLPDDIIHLLH